MEGYLLAMGLGYCESIGWMSDAECKGMIRGLTVTGS